MSTCPNCKYILPAIADFCTNCGVDLHPSDSKSSPTVQKKAICSICAESFPQDAIHRTGDRPICLNCLSRATASQQERKSEKQKREERFRAQTGARGNHRRDAVRFEVPRTVARIRKRGLFARLTEEGKFTPGPVLDLSLSGMQCISPLDLLPEEKIEIRLSIPAFQTPLQACGTVRWVYVEGRNHRLGIQFDRLPAETENHLKGLHEYKTLREVGSGEL